MLPANVSFAKLLNRESSLSSAVFTGMGDAEPDPAVAVALLLPVLDPLVLFGLFLCLMLPGKEFCGVRGEGDGGSEGLCSCSRSAVSGAGGTGVGAFLSSAAAVVVTVAAEVLVELEATLRCRSLITWLWRRA